MKLLDFTKKPSHTPQMTLDKAQEADYREIVLIGVTEDGRIEVSNSSGNPQSITYLLQKAIHIIMENA